MGRSFVVIRNRSGRRLRPSDGPNESRRVELAYVLILAALAAGLATVTLRTEGAEDVSAPSPGPARHASPRRSGAGGSPTPAVRHPGRRSRPDRAAGRSSSSVLGSRDVVHSMWIPELRDKRYAYPDRARTASTPTFRQAGTERRLVLAVLRDRPRSMRFTVHVVSAATTFARWMARVAGHDGDAARRRSVRAVPTVDHKRIAARLMLVCLCFFVVSGAMALAMRTELARPGLQLLSTSEYDQAVHAARLRDGLPGDDATGARPRDLPRAAPDRRDRPGVVARSPCSAYGRSSPAG